MKETKYYNFNYFEFIEIWKFFLFSLFFIKIFM